MQLFLKIKNIHLQLQENLAVKSTFSMFSLLERSFIRIGTELKF